MLISIDGFEASAGERVGVGRFEVELLKHISSIDKKNTYRIYTPGTPTPDMPSVSMRWQYRMCSFNRLWSQVALPYYLISDMPKPDVFFSPVHYAPRYCPVPLVVGVMDLSYVYFPDMFNAGDLYKLKNWTKYSVEKADAVIAISKSTGDDILTTYDVEKNNVHVVYPGTTGFMNQDVKNRTKTVSAKYSISRDYILYVGTLQPRKNIIRLIEAFQKIKLSNYQINNNNLQLVIVGKKGWLYDDIFQKVKDAGLEKDVVFTGFVPDEELPLLYEHATCFCLPSLHEGFGFPVLEAMKYGCPVICSNMSSLPEVAGDAGVLVNPESVDDIARGLLIVISLTSGQRKQMIEKGKKQAAKFTWEKAAKQTIEILERVGRSKQYE